MTLPEIERELRAAMDAWVAKGGKVRRRLGWFCALGVWGRRVMGTEFFWRDINICVHDYFRWDRRDVETFVCAFDKDSSEPPINAIAALGRKLAREYVDGVRE